MALVDPQVKTGCMLWVIRSISIGMDGLLSEFISICQFIPLGALPLWSVTTLLYIMYVKNAPVAW